MGIVITPNTYNDEKTYNNEKKKKIR